MTLISTFINGKLSKCCRNLVRLRRISRVSNDRTQIHVLDEVREAIQNKMPVVALESTIITHGMPYPRNLEMARLVEKTVREHGALPATIAVLDGAFKVGLNESELERLSKPCDNSNQNKTKLKVSRKDLAYAHMVNADGGTTVSATMILANLAGIQFFATGGIGGVHRGAEVTMDISTDLTELSKTPVTVVCAGIKSILDIKKSLEFLETFGVPVATLNSRTFPSFFTNESGIESPLSLPDVESVAKMVWTSKNLLSLSNGMIVAVPNPNPADSNVVQTAITQALQEAEEQNIRGNKITPFLLAKIQELTQGKSLDSNISLVLNNAKIAAKIAVAYSVLAKSYENDIDSHNNGTRHFQTLTSSLITSSSLLVSTSPTGSSEKGTDKSSNSTSVSTVMRAPVVVIGASVMDTIAQSSSPLIPGSSNPGSVRFSPGGVGRNIADRLCRDYLQSVNFITAVGNDENGRHLLKQLADVGVRMDGSIMVSECNLSEPSEQLIGIHHMQSSSASSACTANYLAVHSHNGELFAGIADMKVFQHISREYVRDHLVGVIRKAALIVVDANLSSEAFNEVVAVSSSYLVPIFFEPTSDAKCVLPVLANTINKIDVIKPNVSELVTMVAACHAREMITQGRVSVERALRNLMAPLTASGDNSINTVKSESALADIRVLACALHHVMKSGSSGISLLAKTTAEGTYRKVRGKHVIVSMGSSGVIWIGPKYAVTRGRPTSRPSPLQRSDNNAIAIDEETSMKIFPADSIVAHDASMGTKYSTNGAGDSFCAGVIAALLESDCDELDTACIHSGLAAAARRIMQNAKSHNP